MRHVFHLVKASFLFFLFALPAAADGPGMVFIGREPQGPNPEIVRRDAIMQQQAAEYNAQQAAIAAAYSFALQQQQFMPADPWREIDGETNFAKGDDWKHFCGRVLEVQPRGIRVEGDYGEPLSISASREREFFVADFPYQVAEKDFLVDDHRYTARYVGTTYSYTTTTGSTRTIRRLDYGTPCSIPEWALEIARQQAAAAAEQAKLAKDKAKQKQFDAEKRAFDFYSAPATNGDAFAQFRLGEFYLSGRGAATNYELARFWLGRSAEAGNTRASNLLSKLQSEAPTAAVK